MSPWLGWFVSGDFGSGGVLSCTARIGINNILNGLLAFTLIERLELFFLLGIFRDFFLYFLGPREIFVSDGLADPSDLTRIEQSLDARPLLLVPHVCLDPLPLVLDVGAVLVRRVLLVHKVTLLVHVRVLDQIVQLGVLRITWEAVDVRARGQETLLSLNLWQLLVLVDGVLFLEGIVEAED